MEASGLNPREIVADGKWRRCQTEDKRSKKNGAYVLHPDGRGYFKNWATDTELNAWTDATMTYARPIDQARLQAQRDRDRAYRVQAVRSAREFWRNARPLNMPHRYVAGKGLSPHGCAGLRTHDGLLVVPVMLGDILISIQTITHDGVKRFWPGAPVKGGAYVLRRERAAITVLVEGLATGLAVFQAVRHASVVVCFDAGNLLPVVLRMKPTGSVVVAADNDHKTLARIGTNPGIEKARNVADLIGCGVAFPTGIEGTDWADYMAEHGEGSSKRIERQILAGAKYVMS